MCTASTLVLIHHEKLRTDHLQIVLQEKHQRKRVTLE